MKVLKFSLPNSELPAPVIESKTAEADRFWLQNGHCAVRFNFENSTSITTKKGVKTGSLQYGEYQGIHQGIKQRILSGLSLRLQSK